MRHRRDVFNDNSSFIRTTSRNYKKKTVFDAFSKIYIPPEDVTMLATVIRWKYFSGFSETDFIILQCTNYVSKPRINRFQRNNIRETNRFYHHSAIVVTLTRFWDYRIKRPLLYQIYINDIFIWNISFDKYNVQYCDLSG